VLNILFFLQQEIFTSCKKRILEKISCGKNKIVLSLYKTIRKIFFNIFFLQKEIFTSCKKKKFKKILR